MVFAAWESSSSCVGSARPGAKALLAWCLEAYDAAENLGIYNCRDVRGGSSLSAHAEGRAVDVGMPMVDGRGSPLGYRLVGELARAGSRLGITAIIYDRTIWSAVSPVGRPYLGVHPHYDHVHVEITRNAGERLTLATCRAVLRPKPKPKPASSTWPKEIVKRMKTVDLSDVAAKRSSWVTSPTVARLQGLLLAAGYGPEGLVDRRGRPDGVAGPSTKTALGHFQRRTKTGNGATPDYIAGERTWSALLGV